MSVRPKALGLVSMIRSLESSVGARLASGLGLAMMTPSFMSGLASLMFGGLLEQRRLRGPRVDMCSSWVSWGFIGPQRMERQLSCSLFMPDGDTWPTVGPTRISLMRRSEKGRRPHGQTNRYGETHHFENSRTPFPSHPLRRSDSPPES